MPRPKIPTQTETDVLTQSRRKCCLCYFLKDDQQRKDGQIAHLDQNRENNNIDNLCWLCFEHHNEYDSQTSQSKGLTLNEVKHWRNQMYQRLVVQDLSKPTPDDSPESVAVIIKRYEELIALRQIEHEQLRLQIEQSTLALQQAQRDAEESKAIIERAKATQSVKDIKYAIALEESIRSILYLEPHIGVSAEMVKLLSHLGYVVKPVFTAHDAITELKIKQYDLLIAEVIDLDDEDAIPPDTIEELMKVAKLCDVPGIAVTVLSPNDKWDQPHFLRAILAGFEVVSKPISITALIATIKKLAALKAAKMVGA